MAIKDLPLLPSKTNPAWRRHQRPNGKPALQVGEHTVEPDILDTLVKQVNEQHRGKTVDEKVQYLKKLIEAHATGDTSATGLRGAGMGVPEYGRNFQEQIKGLPQKFDDFVPQSVKQAGDRMIRAGATTGYNIDSYGVGKGDYSRLLREGSNRILYHQYVQHPEHGEELLRRLGQAGITTPYDVTTIATSVKWDSKWGEEPEIELEDGEDGQIGRSVQYVIAFKPTDKREADKLVKIFEKVAKHGQKEAIPHSWFVQDIRSSFKEKVDHFERKVLNIKRMGERELLLLRKEAIDGFTAQNVWLNRDLSKFVKALAIFVLPPFAGRPLVFGRLGKSINVIKVHRSDTL